MTQTSRAVICRELNHPVVVEEIQVDAPKRNEVMVRLHACGVCHSDLSATTGVIALPTPLVLGHEGAGEVVAVGEGVSELSVGDRIITSFINMCGQCGPCQSGRPVLCDSASKALWTLPDGTVRTRDGKGDDLNVFMGCGVMAEYATMHVNNVVRITEDVPMDRAALVGCGVMTGVGAVTNTARLEPGSTAAVFGVGGVGLNAIQGCRIAGARQIIAVDMSEEKLEMAKTFGATHTVLADAGTHKTIRKLTNGGVDYAFECVGSGKVVESAFSSLGKGGQVIVVGVAPGDDRTTVRTLVIPAEEKAIRGSWFGSARPRRDFPRLLGLYASGELKLDELVTHRYSVDEAPQAFADLEAGRNARGVIVFDAMK